MGREYSDKAGFLALFGAMGFLTIFVFSALSQTIISTPSPTPTPMTKSQICRMIGNELGSMSLLNGDICDVVVVRNTPVINAMDGRNLNRFTLMNSVIEFDLANPASRSDDVYVMGDFALLETELNDVLKQVKTYNWTVTGVHNHMILETPKTTFLHWEATGNLNALINQLRNVFRMTSITVPTPTPTPTTTPTPTPTLTPTPTPTPTRTLTPTPTAS
jgi:hypothetical protein